MGVYGLLQYVKQDCWPKESTKIINSDFKNYPLGLCIKFQKQVLQMQFCFTSYFSNYILTEMNYTIKQCFKGNEDKDSLLIKMYK